MLARRLVAAVVATALTLVGQPALGVETVVDDDCRSATLRRDAEPAADPSVIRVGSTYVSVQVDSGVIQVRQASSLDDLLAAPARTVWPNRNDLGSVWAPEIVRDGGRYYIYFSAGDDAGHRMYAISSASPDSGYTDEVRLVLPDDRWAIDGVPVTFNGQRYFLWSGWECTTDVEQNIYIARMSDPLTPVGDRHVISQPREPWERVVGNPFVNEAPQVIKDPNGQLHVVYSANGSWSERYCLADLRLRVGGDPTRGWDWYKSNGCLFGSDPAVLMAGRPPTRSVKGPGHHTFALCDGDIAASPPAGPRFPMMYHAVPTGTPYDWNNRYWYTGAFAWRGDTTYRRTGVPGETSDTGWSFTFFER